MAKKIGIVLDTRTWRGARPWTERLGVSVEELLDLNRQAVSLLINIRAYAEIVSIPIVISGNIGPLSDAYKQSKEPTAAHTREQYHDQIRVLGESEVDSISAMSMTSTEEIVAVVDLRKTFAVPVQISFNLETDGKLLDGRSLEGAIKSVDGATGGYVSTLGSIVHILYAFYQRYAMCPNICVEGSELFKGTQVRRHTRS